MRSSILTSKRAKALRRSTSPPEVMLWSRLRSRGPGHPIFRRQHPLGAYILDFYCPAAKLAVEIDGIGHAGGAQAEHDARRDAWLREQGLIVHRVTAAAVLSDPARAADGIMELARGRLAGDGRAEPAAAPSTACGGPPPPSSSRQGRMA